MVALLGLCATLLDMMLCVSPRRHYFVMTAYVNIHVHLLTPCRMPQALQTYTSFRQNNSAQSLVKSKLGNLH
jgi:hypothetical protein